MRAYARSGFLGIDLFFVAAALAVVFVLDVGVWHKPMVRIGTVAGLALLRLVVSLAASLISAGENELDLHRVLTSGTILSVASLAP
jgi:hypothetical protein